MAYAYYLAGKLSANWHSAQVALQVNSQNIVNNTSNVTIILQVREDVEAASYNLTGSAVFWISVDGIQKKSKTTFDWRNYTKGSWYNELTWTGDISHGTDGSKVISLDAYINTNVGAGTFSPTAVNVTLPTIPRKSILGSPSMATLEGAFSVLLTKYSSSFYDVLAISVNGTLIKTVNGYTSGASVIFSDEELLAAYNVLDDMTPSVSFSLSTYSSSAKTTLIGSSGPQVVSPSIGGTLKRNITGVWKNCLVYKKINGTWKRCIAYRRVSGTWEKGV